MVSLRSGRRLPNQAQNKKPNNQLNAAPLPNPAQNRKELLAYSNKQLNAALNKYRIKVTNNSRSNKNSKVNALKQLNNLTNNTIMFLNHNQIENIFSNTRLRSALRNRKLSTNGNKSDLVKRLKNAIINKRKINVQKLTPANKNRALEFDELKRKFIRKVIKRTRKYNKMSINNKRKLDEDIYFYYKMIKAASKRAVTRNIWKTITGALSYMSRKAKGAAGGGLRITGKGAYKVGVKIAVSLAFAPVQMITGGVGTAITSANPLGIATGVTTAGGGAVIGVAYIYYALKLQKTFKTLVKVPITLNQTELKTYWESTNTDVNTTELLNFLGKSRDFAQRIGEEAIEVVKDKVPEGVGVSFEIVGGAAVALGNKAWAYGQQQKQQLAIGAANMIVGVGKETGHELFERMTLGMLTLRGDGKGNGKKALPGK